MSTKNLELKPPTSETLRIHRQALSASRHFLKSEFHLLEALSHIDQKKVYSKLGYPSLFRYVTQELKLSEAIAYTLILVCRKCDQVPKLKTSIENGDFTLSKARKIVSVLTPENQEYWLTQAKELTSRQLEKAVATENPRSAVPERAHYVSEKRLELTLGIDESVILALRKAQDQISSVKRRPVSLEETLNLITQFYLMRNDPLERAKRIMAKKGLKPISKPAKRDVIPNRELFTGTVLQSSPERPTSISPHKNEGANLKAVSFSNHTQIRIAIPADVEHAVRIRDQNRCQFILPQGAQCNEQRWIELHHIIPVSQGGDHSVQNIVTLCFNHHQMLHQQ